MSIISFIKNKVCKQPVIYWGNPQNDGFGGLSFDAPVQIKCRWTGDSQLLHVAQNAVEMTDRSDVLVTQDLDEQGFLCLGLLSEFDGIDITNPLTVAGAHQIFKMKRTPLFGSKKEFVYIANLRLERR